MLFFSYSAFGEEKLEGSVKSPWRFSSKRSDEETNLVHFGRRFYLPELGRWLTPDPAGFTDGMNLYAFYSVIEILAGKVWWENIPI